MSETSQLVLLPGVGADHRLLEPQRAAFPDLVVPDWIPPERNESLVGYAARMAETVPVAQPLVLGGVSFGGMLAYEMARSLRPDVVVLISSMQTRRGLPLSYRMIRRLSPVLPTFVFSLAKPLASPMLAVTSQLTRQQRRECATMFREIDSRFVRWALTALIDWKPQPLEGIPIREIHGRRDRVLPARRSEADEFVPRAGHLMNLTHAQAVNEFIREAMPGCFARESMAQ